MRRITDRNSCSLILTTILFAGAALAADNPKAVAHLKDAKGEDVGTATFTGHGDYVTMDATFEHLSPGMHGIHIHETGVCTAPEFTSAGGHFNPTHKKHGLLSPDGPHAGDLQNVGANAHGEAKIHHEKVHVTLASSGDNSLMKTGGTAVVIHAGPDDYKTDPSGSSGARIACGVIQLEGAQISQKK